MEQCFIAAGKSWPDLFALSHSSQSDAALTVP
jgi:hypothetical protein